MRHIRQHPFAAVVVAVVLTFATGKTTRADAANDRPNIILIMADDMGWGAMDFPVRLGETAQGKDIEYPGTKLWQTPNLRAMANNGLVFSRMYSQSSVCSPTRASVLTGRSPERLAITNANRGRMENREVTLAEYAKRLGYNTGLFGKWHMGVFTRDIKDANRGGRPNSHDHYSIPSHNGFDTYYATESKTSTYDPGTSGLTTATRYWTAPGKFIALDDPQIKGDDSAIIVREANQFIQAAVKSDTPFFTVVWFHTPHKPLNTPGNKHVDNLAAYKFAMEDLDRAVGDLRDKLRQLGVADNTLICFTSDNGPEDDQDYCTDPLRANKRELYEGGVRVPGLIEWPARVQPGQTHTPMVTSDYLPTILDIWGIEPLASRPLDGQSMADVLLNDRAAKRTQPIISIYANGHRSVVGEHGRYKLITTNKGKDWAIYDIVTDYQEKNALVTTKTLTTSDPKHTAIYQSLLADYDAWTQSIKQSLQALKKPFKTSTLTKATGATPHYSAPPSLKPGKAQSDTPALYQERQHNAHGKSLRIDDTNFDRDVPFDSFLLHWDAKQDNASASVTLVFNRPVLGVIDQRLMLIATDTMSFTDTAFSNNNERGLEANDRWELSDDRKILTINLTGSKADLDQLRILTISELAEIDG